MCSTCGKPVLMDGFCCRHLKQTCRICFEEVGSTNTISSKRLSCGHSFHPDCIMNWFVTSDECPVCRAKQEGDAILQFREKVEDSMRVKYKDAIDSLETEVQNLKETLRLQTMFVNSSAEGVGFFALAELAGADLEIPEPERDLMGFSIRRR